MRPGERRSEGSLPLKGAAVYVGMLPWIPEWLGIEPGKCGVNRSRAPPRYPRTRLERQGLSANPCGTYLAPVR